MSLRVDEFKFFYYKEKSWIINETKKGSYIKVDEKQIEAMEAEVERIRAERLVAVMAKKNDPNFWQQVVYILRCTHFEIDRSSGRKIERLRRQQKKIEDFMTKLRKRVTTMEEKALKHRDRIERATSQKCFFTHVYVHFQKEYPTENRFMSIDTEVTLTSSPPASWRSSDGEWEDNFSMGDSENDEFYGFDSTEQDSG